MPLFFQSGHLCVVGLGVRFPGIWRAGGTFSHQGAAWDQGGGRPGALPRVGGSETPPTSGCVGGFPAKSRESPVGPQGWV